MQSEGVLKKWRLRAICQTSILALTTSSYLVTATASFAASAENLTTATPIKHVIILIGENRGLDHTFGVYKPKGAGQTISNLLSKKIVKEDGSPGAHFNLAKQFFVAGQSAWYFGAPKRDMTAYDSSAHLMPQPNTNGTPQSQSASSPPFNSLATASLEPDVEPQDTVLLTTGFSNLPTGSLDTRVPGAGNLPNGPFQLQGPILSDDDYTGDMTHRFYQAAQQQNCSKVFATADNPPGCTNNLFAFVMDTYSATNKSKGNEMGFLNAIQGQAPLLKALADRFTLSDNFHQSFLGGTGANHFMLGTGDAAFWSDGHGNPTTPPTPGPAGAIDPDRVRNHHDRSSRFGCLTTVT